MASNMFNDWNNVIYENDDLFLCDDGVTIKSFFISYANSEISKRVPKKAFIEELESHNLPKKGHIGKSYQRAFLLGFTKLFSITIPRNSTKPKVRAKVVELLKLLVNSSFMNSDVKDSKQNCEMRVESQKNSAIVESIVRSKHSDLTKIALIFSLTSVVEAPDEATIIPFLNQIVAANSPAEDSAYFDLNHIMSYATPFYPSPVLPQKSSDQKHSIGQHKSAPFAMFLDAANSILGEKHDNTIRNARKYSRQMTLNNILVICSSGQKNRYKNVDMKKRFSSLNFIDMYAALRAPEDNRIIDFIYSSERQVNPKSKQFPLLTDSEISVIPRDTKTLYYDNDFADVVVQYGIAKYGLYEESVEISKISRIHRIRRSDYADQIWIDNYYNDTQANTPVAVWYNLNFGDSEISYQDTF